VARDPRYDVLFEPVRIGPVTARNRFYQVPHCTGFGHRRPQGEAALRAVKAEGGWAVVCTQEVEVAASSDVEPWPDGRLWDDGDLPALARVAEAVHAHGALAGIELSHNGPSAANLYSREPPLAPSHTPVSDYEPVQARAMSRRDIAELRRLHRLAALRARRAGFDIVYVYAGHALALPMHFLSRRWNRRSDEYGGPLENRARLLRELIEDTREAVGDACAVAVRLAVEELLGPAGITAEGEGREVVELLAELPDLWDVNVSNWSNDSLSSRFAGEGAQTPYVEFVKRVTTKPVVGVGRFTSPDAMVAQVRKGVLDFIGAARPSIADPFLPRKIDTGRIDDIRECIGCNICVASHNRHVPIRCTQNPTMGEEWRRGWHPERIGPKRSDEPVLVVGAGPAGLECALALGRRGYPVTLAEARAELGGRVTEECRLPGLAAWARVRDHRTYLIAQMGNVTVYRESRLAPREVLELGLPRVLIATGARWRRDGIGRWHRAPIPGWDAGTVLTPEEVMAGAESPDPVLLFDDDHYYLGGAIAERLARAGREVVLATPAAMVSQWTVHTLEQGRIQARLLELGVEIRTGQALAAIAPGEVELECVWSGRKITRAARSLVMVTSRLPEDGLHEALAGEPEALAAAGVRTLARIGDCLAPSTIAAAVWSGHRAARELDESPPGEPGFRRERPPAGPPAGTLGGVS